ncbi:hypothetical protein [Pseudomonas kairouanensis]|uniref:hypothetical protein n=1 Tax=Pseudomonas kairouanensis TaxID=2293832 RepID=UPI00142EDB7B|nr:hypothetical protein [Pseudomonas kairouanensis]
MTPALAVLIIVDAARSGQPESAMGANGRLQLYVGDVVVIGSVGCRPFAKLPWIAKNSS